MTDQGMSDALNETLVSATETDRDLDPANVVDGLFAIARGLDRIADALFKLGLGDASTPMGALESAAAHLGEKIEAAASTISEAIT